MAENTEITTNGLARLFSIEFIVGFGGLLFTIGIAYNALGSSIEANANQNKKQDERLALMEATQRQLVESATAARISDQFQIQNQEQMRQDIARILDILEARRPK